MITGRTTLRRVELLVHGDRLAVEGTPGAVIFDGTRPHPGSTPTRGTALTEKSALPATLEWDDIDDLAVDTARVLAMDAVQKVGNGHPAPR